MTDSEPAAGLVLCDSIHHVLALEKPLRAARVPVDLVPVPRTLSSDCGVAIEFPLAALDAVRDVLGGRHAPWRGIYRRTGEAWEEIGGPTRR